MEQPGYADGNDHSAECEHMPVPYAWREIPPFPPPPPSSSPSPRRRAAPSVRRITNAAATVALTCGLLAFVLWPAALGITALITGAAGWLTAKDDDGPGGLLATAGFVFGARAMFPTS